MNLSLDEAHRDLAQSEHGDRWGQTMAMNPRASANPWRNRLALSTNAHRAQTTCHFAKSTDPRALMPRPEAEVNNRPLDLVLARTRGAIARVPIHRPVAHQRDPH